MDFDLFIMILDYIGQLQADEIRQVEIRLAMRKQKLAEQIRKQSEGGG